MVYQIVADPDEGISKMWDVDEQRVHRHGQRLRAELPRPLAGLRHPRRSRSSSPPGWRSARSASPRWRPRSCSARSPATSAPASSTPAPRRCRRPCASPAPSPAATRCWSSTRTTTATSIPVLVRSVGKGARRRTLPLAPGDPRISGERRDRRPWGRPEALDMVREVAGELAAVLVEPVQSRQPELIPVDFVREVKRDRRGARVPAGLRRGHHRHPPGSCAVRRSSTESRPTSPPTARSSAAAPCRSASSAASRVHGHLRRRPVAVWRRFVPGEGRHLLRRHLRAPAACDGGLPRGARARQGAAGPEYWDESARAGRPARHHRRPDVPRQRHRRPHGQLQLADVPAHRRRARGTAT